VTLNDKLEASPDVVARMVGGETMLLDLASGTYFGLDLIGGKIWDLLEKGASLTQVCDVIEREHAVERRVLEQDVLRLASELADKQLIVPVQ
jgi:Coenzyme PQQ synthesis protein D (PqqD)